MLPRALLIDDDPAITILLEHLLVRHGFDTFIVADGEAAIACIAGGAAPQLVILDVELPYLDGFEVLDRLRAEPGWERVPVIMLSARSDEREVVRALDAGADDYLVKPFRPGELLARVRRLQRWVRD